MTNFCGSQYVQQFILQMSRVPASLTALGAPRSGNAFYSSLRLRQVTATMITTTTRYQPSGRNFRQQLSMNANAPRQSPGNHPTRPRLPAPGALTLAACVLALVLIFAFGERGVYARGAPNRNDRRPDRETRLRYPNTRSTSTNNRSGSSRTLRSAPEPSPSASPEPSTDEQPKSSQRAPSASQGD